MIAACFFLFLLAQASQTDCPLPSCQQCLPEASVCQLCEQGFALN
jgi:hypothetical protein